MSLSRAQGAEKRAWRDRRVRAAKCAKLALAMPRATGCNSPQMTPSGSNHGGEMRRRPMHGTIDLAGDPSEGRRRQGLVDSARRYRRQPARTVQDQFLLAVFRPAAQGSPGALLQGQHVRAVLVGDQVPRHHGHRDQSFGVLVGGFARRHHHPRRRPPICAAKASSRWTSRAIRRSARPWRRCSRRRISTSSRSTSASGRPNASTICLPTKCSTGSTRSRSN